jgi:glycerophosphoryl diester phosphodiesterase
LIFSFFPKAWAQTYNSLQINGVDDLKELFSYSSNPLPIICGHRGGINENFPENSIAAFENTLSKIPAFFEVDPRLTKDSVVVVFHDAKLDNKTTGTGNLSDYNYEDLQQFNLKDSKGKVTDAKIPSIDEVFEWAKEKTVLMLDKKNVPLPLLLEKINQHNAESYVLVSTYKPQEAEFYHKRNKNIMFEAFIKSEADLKAYENTGIPWENIVAYVGQPKKLNLYKLLHEKGVMCIAYTAPKLEKIKDKEERLESYRTTIIEGADILLANDVFEVYEAVQPLFLKTDQKKEFIVQKSF